MVRAGKAVKTPYLDLQCSVQGRNERAWPRRASGAYLIGRRSGRGCCTLEGRGMSYGTWLHDRKLGELEYMKYLSLSVWVLVSRKFPMI
jgi:hypothetical protein